jgi:phosphatidylglycerol lysyltransferase
MPNYSSLRGYIKTHRGSLERWSVMVLAILTALMALVNMLSAATHPLQERLAILSQVFPFEVRHGSHFTSLLAGFALFILSVNLWRRKRIAWGLTIVLLLVSIPSHLLKGLDYEEASLAGALLLLLILSRSQFYALSDHPSVRQGLLVLVFALVFTLAYGTAGFYLLDRQFKVQFDLLSAFRQTVVMFVAFYDPGLQPITGFGRYFAGSIYAIGLISLSYSLVMLARPVLLRYTPGQAEYHKAETIIKQYAATSLARLCLLNDKSYLFSQGGSVITFVKKGRMAITLGDPIGPPEDVRGAIEAFQTFCARNDWRTAFYQTLPDHLDIYRQSKFDTLNIGQEAIVDLTAFTLDGGGNKSIRTSINKLNKLGYRAEVIQAPLSQRLLEELRSISNEWLTMVHGKEQRFSVGWFQDEYIRNERVMVIYTPEGAISAFTNILPEYQKNEVTVDMIRRRTDAPGGTMDYLFVSLFLWAKEHRFSTFSLGLSALSGVGEQSNSPVPEKVIHYTYEHIDQFYNFKGLHEFKEKYHPAWAKRYLVYPGAASLPDVITALARAEAGDTFILDYLRDLLKK